jgi:hypothetical protein
MDSDRRMPSWLKATIRSALIATAVGGGLFALSQVLAPSEAHAETVSAEAPAGSGDSLLGSTLSGVGSTLGAVTGVADSTVGGVGKVVTAVTTPVNTTVSTVVSTTVNALPAPVQAPVKQVTAPVVNTVTHVTQPVTNTVSQLAAAKPVGSLVGGVSSTVDSVVTDVEQVPVVGGVVSGIAGQNPVSTVLSPAASGLDNTVGSVAETVDTTVTDTTGALTSSLTPDGSDSSEPGSLPTTGGVAPSTPDAIGTPDASTSAHAVADSDSSSVAAPLEAVGAATNAGAPFGPALHTFPEAGQQPLAAADAALAAAHSAPLGGTAPTPAPLAPGAGLASAGGSAGTSASGSGGSGTTALAGTIGDFFFPAALAGFSSLVDGDALPASPVFENDSSPD